MYHPSRGGVRGGQDQFEWDDVKTDKYRENYLGHSLMAPVGRWQKGKDINWYSKEKDGSSAKADLSAIKRAEEEAMMAALGFQPPKKESTQTLTKEELVEAFKRTNDTDFTNSYEKTEGIGANTYRGQAKSSKNKTEGIEFVSLPNASSRKTSPPRESQDDRKEQKKRKKHKRERSPSSDNSSNNGPDKRRKKHKKHSTKETTHSYTDDNKGHSKKSKKSKHKSHKSKKSKKERRHSSNPSD